MKYFLAAAALAALAVPSLAQDTVSAAPEQSQPPALQAITPPPEPIAPKVTANAVLRAGSPVSLRFMEEVTTKKKAARVGQRVQLEVAAPVEVNGVDVIQAGTPAWGEITDVRNKGMWGKSGHLEMRALYLRVNGRQIRLTGTVDDKGVTGTAGVVASVALVPVVGFFVTGTSAVLPKGGTFDGFIDEDVELAIAKAKPAPLVVGGEQERASEDASTQ